MEYPLLILTGALLALAVMVVTSRWVGFAAQKPSDYAGTGPLFDLREQLSGPLLCEGVIYGPTGRVVSRFVAEMEGRWEGNRGVLAESFCYDSGATQQREWRLTLGNDGTLSAEADDVVGIGTGCAQGAALHLQYRIRLPESAGGHVLDATDWMYLVENGTVVNRSQFCKYGIRVAELVATMRKKDS